MSSSKDTKDSLSSTSNLGLDFSLVAAGSFPRIISRDVRSYFKFQCL